MGCPFTPLVHFKISFGYKHTQTERNFEKYYETFMSRWLTKNDENCSQDSRDGCPTMSGDFI